MKKTILSLLVALMATTGAWADYGWYSGSMTIGGVTTDCTAWSTDGNNPTDLGFVTDMTITSVAFNVWSDANDRGGANMFFRIWDGGSSQVGSDQDLWLGSSTRIAGDHDFAISWTGTLDLAKAVGLTLVPGKTYYVDMYTKTYGTSGDEWYSGNGANFHTKLTYAGPATSGIDWNTSTNSGTFTMPAYDMEVSTELWYRLKEDADNSSDLKAKTNVFLERTLQTGGWNTFSVPFDINPIPAGWTVKTLSSSSFNTTTKELTLNFSDEETKIAAGVPYLIKVDAAYDFTADGHEFEGVTQDYTAHNAETDYADFVPAMDRVNLAASQDILFVSGGNTLTYPTSAGYMKGFRAYFQLKGDAAAAARVFNMSFDDESTGIRLTPNPSPEGEGSVYDLSGRKLSNGQMKKGVYIQNGKKRVIK
jgi:hypothetical protein